jgi:hypothetical protein
MRRLPLSFASVLATALLVSTAGAAGAQDARVLPTWDPLYHDVHRLAAAGLLPGHPVGVRPWSLRNLRTAAEIARRELESRDMDVRRKDALRATLERLERVVGPGVPRRVAALDVRVEALFAEGDTRGTPDNGQGGIDDGVRPLLAYRGGRAAPDGGLLSAEPAGVWAPSDALAVELRPRIQISSDDGAGISEAEIATLQARAVLGPVAISLGRGEVVWGGYRDESLLLSGNARGLDRLEIASDVPLRLGILGPVTFMAFLADLGGDRAVPHGKLVGARLSVRPHPRLELGWSYLNQQSGEGAPEADFWERVADVFVVPDLFRSGEDFEFSEKLMGGDLRWRIPSSAGLELFVEGVLTDFDDGRLGSILIDDASWRGGLELSTLGGAGLGWIRASATRTGLRFYRHAQFPSGLTLDRAVLGSALGPDALGARLQGGFEDGAGRRWEVSAAWESRSADVYGFFPDGDPVFPTLEDRSEETRLRASLRLSIPAEPLWLELAGGVESIRAFDFTPGDDRVAGFVALRAFHLPR